MRAINACSGQAALLSYALCARNAWQHLPAEWRFSAGPLRCPASRERANKTDQPMESDMASTAKINEISFAMKMRAAPVQSRQALRIESRPGLRDLDDRLTEALMESFPASDPISSLRLA
jgi:hypothetical protein